jgi:Xaa-Pro aminopeptidase
MLRLHAAALASALLASALAPSPAAAHPPPGVPDAVPIVPPPPAAVGGARLDELQGQLGQAHLDGWLLCDDGATDAPALEVVRPSETPTRRWFYFLPAAGEPTAIVAERDARAFDAVAGKRVLYRSWRELETALKSLLRGRKRVAMAYSPRAAVPVRGRLDAGTVDLVRAQGVVVVPDGELLSHVEVRWSEAARASHLVAARQLVALKDLGLRYLGERLRAGGHPGEYEVAAELWRALAGLGLESEALPVVAAGANAADPGYAPGPRRSSEIRPGDVVVLRLAARQLGLGEAPYAELVWTAYVGDKAPARVQAAWSAAREARDRGVALVVERRAKQQPVAAHEVDGAIRAALDKAGVADRAPPPTGHSLGRRLRAGGPVLDDVDTHDDRMLLVRSGVVVEPGVYFPGEWGVATSADVYLGDKAAEVTSGPLQAEVEPIAPAPAPSSKR